MTAEEISIRYRNNVQQAVARSFDTLGKIRIILLEPFYFPLERSDLSYRYTPHPYCEADFPRPDRDDTDETVQKRLEAIALVQNAARAVAEQNGCIFVPLRERFEQAFADSRREYFIWDGTHPTVAGHTLIAKAWLDTVK